MHPPVYDTKTRNVSPQANVHPRTHLPNFERTRAYPSTRVTTTLARRWRAAHCCSSLSPDRSEASLRSLSPPPLLPKASSITLRATPTPAPRPPTPLAAPAIPTPPRSFFLRALCVADFFHVGASERPRSGMWSGAVERGGRKPVSSF